MENINVLKPEVIIGDYNLTPCLINMSYKYHYMEGSRVLEVWYGDDKNDN